MFEKMAQVLSEVTHLKALKHTPVPADKLNVRRSADNLRRNHEAAVVHDAISVVATDRVSTSNLRRVCVELSQPKWRTLS